MKVTPVFLLTAIEIMYVNVKVIFLKFTFRIMPTMMLNETAVRVHIQHTPECHVGVCEFGSCEVIINILLFVSSHLIHGSLFSLCFMQPVCVNALLKMVEESKAKSM